MFAGGNHTIMTTLATAVDFGMIYNRRWRPRSSGMTGLAYIGGVNMIRRLAGGR